ncbi:unnamed protein product [Pseudo-nitzschia multistriata]|uniref:G protein gamma domain-containing protein n=1 Tax=Pseudo-nitzschia multistriata TaxID=183589 RepID=A0A448YV33_9STRA|nr:unnamed protein product [Pseudo-nitzschia multistriata]
MSEIVGLTEVQDMEAEVKLLKAKLEKVEKAENMSKACSRIAAAVSSNQENDAFVLTEGSLPNKFHTMTGSGGEAGCCVVS